MSATESTLTYAHDQTRKHSIIVVTLSGCTPLEHWPTFTVNARRGLVIIR